MTTDTEITAALHRLATEHALTCLIVQQHPASAHLGPHSRWSALRGEAIGAGDTLADALRDLPPPRTIADDIAELERKLAEKRAALDPIPENFASLSAGDPLT